MQTLVHAVLQLQLQEVYTGEKFIYIFVVPYILFPRNSHCPLSANIVQWWYFCSYPLTKHSTQNIKTQNSSSSPYSTLNLLSGNMYTCNMTVSQIKLRILPDKEWKLVDTRLSPAMVTQNWAGSFVSPTLDSAHSLLNKALTSPPSGGTMLCEWPSLLHCQQGGVDVAELLHR